MLVTYWHIWTKMSYLLCQMLLYKHKRIFITNVNNCNCCISDLWDNHFWDKVKPYNLNYAQFWLFYEYFPTFRRVNETKAKSQYKLWPHHLALTLPFFGASTRVPQGVPNIVGWVGQVGGLGQRGTPNGGFPETHFKPPMKSSREVAALGTVPLILVVG